MGILNHRLVKAFLRKAGLGTTEVFVNFDNVLANVEQSSPSLKAKLAQTPESFFVWVQKVTQIKIQKMHIFGSTPIPIEYRDFHVTSDMPSIEISSALQLEAPDFATVNVVLVGEPQSHLNAIKATVHPKGIDVTNLEIDGFINDFKKSTETTNLKIYSFHDISDDVKKKMRLSLEKASQYGSSKILLSYAAWLVINHWPDIVERRSKCCRLAGLKAKEFFQKLYPNYKISPCGLYIEKMSSDEVSVT